MSVHFEQVSFEHPNGFAAIRELSLHVQPGEHIALIGPSGAGKTTLLSLIGTRLQPTTGSLTVLGQHMVDVDNHALCQLRKRIAFIYQHPPMPPRQRVITAVTAGRLGHWPVWKSLASLFYPMDIPGASEVLSRVQLGDKLFDLCDQLLGQAEVGHIAGLA
jgi:phosphonate transport system ATP-binding protein